MITASKRSLYRTLISRNSNNPKKLWPVLNSLLPRTLSPSFPAFSSASNLAESFLNFFQAKVTKLASSFLLQFHLQRIIHLPSHHCHFLHLFLPLSQKLNASFCLYQMQHANLIPFQLHY